MNNDYVKKVEELGLRMDDTQTMLMRPKKPFPENLIIPDGVKSVNKEVFRSFPKLETVIMPDSIESIGDYVFCGSRKLRKVKMSDFFFCRSFVFLHSSGIVPYHDILQYDKNTILLCFKRIHGIVHCLFHKLSGI